MVKAKKSFGQNFLQDAFYLDQIFQAIPDTQNIALEIGPGLGDLTEKLLIKKSVVAVEIDSDLEIGLKRRFGSEIANGRFQLVMGDVMKSWPQLDSYELVANLPYYVATPITLEALKQDNCKAVCVLLQKEVALKFAANVGDSNYGAISVLASLSGQKKIVCDIPPQAFLPAPKVWSAFLRIDKNTPLSFNWEMFSKWLFIAFAQPRKTLLKNLSQAYSKDNLMANFEELGIGQTARPHEVAPIDYLQLFKSTNKF